jgi:hypothetical protein
VSVFTGSYDSVQDGEVGGMLLGQPLPHGGSGKLIGFFHIAHGISPM